jgi:fibro-slime domain-containing protein
MYDVEACDDGNTVSGDGCSATCTIEPGFTCTQPPLGDSILVPIVYRDFRYHNPAEFEPGTNGTPTPILGIAAANLDAQGKPVYTGNVAGSFIASVASFSEWYRDTPGVNHTTASKLALWNNGQGAYVNRYGPSGEQWPLTIKAYFCGSVGGERLDANGAPIPCTSKNQTADCDKDAAMGYTMISCTVESGNYTAMFQTGVVDGTPLFFPVDGDTFTPATERSSATYDVPYASGFTQEAGMPQHNFSFTSEVRYWFKYDAQTRYTLDFLGDDDVWLFVNKRLAVDLGGIHAPVSGSVTFGAGAAADFGLQDGQVYEVAVFQAERQTTGSSYKLTLSGFSSAPSECSPICGDGIVSIGEECDDGVNAGGYGKCGPGCKLGAYCGDGVVQAPEEDCDDGVNIGSPCPSGCHILIVP